MTVEELLHITTALEIFSH